LPNFLEITFFWRQIKKNEYFGVKIQKL